jgi:hypothetical protein
MIKICWNIIWQLMDGEMSHVIYSELMLESRSKLQ